MDWGCGGYRDWAILLPHSPSHRDTMVRCRISCLLGLGRKLSLFNPRQRRSCSGTSVEFVFARLALDYWRHGWTRGQRIRVCGGRADCGRIRPGVPKGDVWRDRSGFLVAPLPGMTNLLSTTSNAPC